MKQSLIFVCLLIHLSAYSQDIPKNADIIIVHSVTFDKVVNSLLDSGYIIEKMDKDFQTLKTEYRKLCKDCIPEIIFNVRVKDSIATITGKWRSTGNFIGGLSSNKDADNALIFDIKNEKTKVPRMAFQAMKTFALSLNGNVMYLISK
jgi:hypothetical protein